VPPADELDLRVERVVAGGAALARDATGRVVFVAGALPGERVIAAVERSARDFARAVTVEVVEASPMRVTAACPAVVRGCGGCDWQHVAPAHQAALKREIVADAFRRTARVADVAVEGGPEVPASAGRTTIRVATGRPDGLGFRSRRSHDVVPITACPAAHPLVADLLGRVRWRGSGELVLRAAARTGERLAYAPPPGATARRDGAVEILEVPDGVAVGRGAAVHEVVRGVRLRVSAPSFFQPSPEGAEALVDAVRTLAGDALDGATAVADLYGGGGLFTACAVPPSARAVLVESSASAVDDARVNLAGRDAVVLEGRVGTVDVPPVDVALADPPRAGLGRDGVAALVATRAGTVVLVSCDPVAGARDVRWLIDAGYQLRRVLAVDQFPHTSHVEVVSLLVR
jgi:tRNA/tmRNA/rRNA uracil-C5-methylase (TrmA/RlmC/RlmD family)